MTTPSTSSVQEAERPMPADEKAWLEVATHALYRAQAAAGVQALAREDLALLHRYQATHSALLDLTRLADDTSATSTCCLCPPFSCECEVPTWLRPGAWEARLDKEREKLRTDTSPGIPAGAEVVLGFDGSFSGDSTALVACDLNGMVLGVVGCWEKPDDARPDWHVPMAEVVGAIRKACTTYRVREVAYDPRIWQQAFEELSAEGLPVVVFPQGAEMLRATQRLYEGVARGEVGHDGDPRLARHMGNCVGTQVAGGVRVGKETRTSTRWVDLAIAAAMAYETACGLTDRVGRGSS